MTATITQLTTYHWLVKTGFRNGGHLVFANMAATAGANLTENDMTWSRLTGVQRWMLAEQ